MWCPNRLWGEERRTRNGECCGKRSDGIKWETGWEETVRSTENDASRFSAHGLSKEEGLLGKEEGRGGNASILEGC